MVLDCLMTETSPFSKFSRFVESLNFSANLHRTKIEHVIFQGIRSLNSRVFPTFSYIISSSPHKYRTTVTWSDSIHNGFHGFRMEGINNRIFPFFLHSEVPGD